MTDLHYTTLAEIRRHDPCARGLATLTAALGANFLPDAPIGFGRILETNGLDDALWALRADLHPKARQTEALLCADIAEMVLPIFERDRPDDDRPRKCIEARRAWANDPTEENRARLAAARDAAWAAWAARAAEAAAWAAAEAAAWAAADAAAWAAAEAAAWAAAMGPARDKIATLFRSHYGPLRPKTSVADGYCPSCGGRPVTPMPDPKPRSKGTEARRD